MQCGAENTGMFALELSSQAVLTVHCSPLRLPVGCLSWHGAHPGRRLFQNHGVLPGLMPGFAPTSHKTQCNDEPRDLGAFGFSLVATAASQVYCNLRPSQRNFTECGDSLESEWFEAPLVRVMLELVGENVSLLELTDREGNTALLRAAMPAPSFLFDAVLLVKVCVTSFGVAVAEVAIRSKSWSNTCLRHSHVEARFLVCGAKVRARPASSHHTPR